MYIQPPQRGFGQERPLTVPRDYSGNTFRAPPVTPMAPLMQEPPADEAPAQETSPIADTQDTPDVSESPTEDAVPTGAAPQKEKGLLSRFPFLSSLLPPKRGDRHEGDFPEWALIGLVLLLLSEDANDILPFLLLLLLWD